MHIGLPFTFNRTLIKGMTPINRVKSESESIPSHGSVSVFPVCPPTKGHLLWILVINYLTMQVIWSGTDLNQPLTHLEPFLITLYDLAESCQKV